MRLPTRLGTGQFCSSEALARGPGGFLRLEVLGLDVEPGRRLVGYRSSGGRSKSEPAIGPPIDYYECLAMRTVEVTGAICAISMGLTPSPV
jgi:hypothetical protein